MSKFITAKRASEILGVTPHYVRKLIKDQKIIGQQIKNSNRWQVDRTSIEQYQKTDIFKQDLADMSNPHQITLKEAVENVEECFDGDVILYMMNTGIIEQNDSFNLNNLLSNLDARQKGIGKKFKKIILVLHSNGGILEAALKIVGILETYANEFEVIVPLIAKSAASILALSSKVLYLTPASELGPVDPIIQSPTNPSIRLPAHIIEQVANLNNNTDPYLLGAYKAAQDFSNKILSKCIKIHNLNEQQEENLKNIFLKQNSHSYPILYNDLEKFKIGKLISNDLGLSAVNTLMCVFNAYMINFNIIKTISTRSQNSNLVLQSPPVKQRSIETNN